MSQPLFYQTLGFFRNHRLRRILTLKGYELRAGLPPENGQVVVWGRTKYASRGTAIAKRRSASVLTLEDAFLRSIRTGRMGEPPLGAVIDRQGAYFDANQPSDLEDILNNAALDGEELQQRSKDGMAFLARHHLSKYNANDPKIAVPEPGYVLVVDQTRGDASIRLGGASAQSFQQMLNAARAENPGQRIVIKTHPETAANNRKGHFSRQDCDERTQVFSDPATPQNLLNAASAVYVVSSLMGFEAILAGHRPVVFGKPFYAGWGLSDDRQTMARRQRQLSPSELFAGAMLEYPTWYDPYRDCLTSFETVAEILAAQARAWREDCHSYTALGIRRWKRPHFRKFFKASGLRLAFEDEGIRAGNSAKRGLIWAGKEVPALTSYFADRDLPLLRVEDGFLRSNGLGADLVPPVSLVVDDLGIYYDPTRESRLERLVNEGKPSAADLDRAARLRDRLVRGRLSKYNLEKSAEKPDLPKNRKIILVPGQVEDDQSILKGTDKIATNAALLAEVRRQNPEAFILYKPHPDVEAGLRKGRLGGENPADLILSESNPIAAIELAEEVWTMTSLLGFEALLRGKPVTCLGTPFYAGWGLTTDLGEIPERRVARPGMPGFIHAVLIEYPRYFDPVSETACPVEVAVDRLEAGLATGGPRWLAKVQGWAGPLAFLWR